MLSACQQILTVKYVNNAQESDCVYIRGWSCRNAQWITELSYDWSSVVNKLLWSKCVDNRKYNNNNNNNKHDNVYGAVIMAEPLREFTRFI